MNSTILRLDWYSFVLGTQVSSITTILTPAPYNILRRLRFPREYVSPSIHNGGNTIFYYRIKDTGNIAAFGSKLVMDVFERNIIGGCMFVLLEKFLGERAGDLPNAFVCGTALGMMLSWSQSADNSANAFLDACFCGITAGQVAACGEEVKHLILSWNDLPTSAFKYEVSFNKMSFWTGAITGCCLASLEDFHDIMEQIDLLAPPEPDPEDMPAERLRLYRNYGLNLLACVLKAGIRLVGKMIMGGLIYCGTEKLLTYHTGAPNPYLALPVCASVLGLYCGVRSGMFYYYSTRRIKRAWMLSLQISSCCFGVFTLIDKYGLAPNFKFSSS